MSEPEMRCVPIVGDDGEVVAVARMDPDASPEAQAAIRALVDAARRQFEADLAADPKHGQRQEAAIQRIRERARRYSGEAS